MGVENQRIPVCKIGNKIFSPPSHNSMKNDKRAHVHKPGYIHTRAQQCGICYLRVVVAMYPLVTSENCSRLHLMDCGAVMLQRYVYCRSGSTIYHITQYRFTHWSANYSKGSKETWVHNLRNAEKIRKWSNYRAKLFQYNLSP